MFSKNSKAEYIDKPLSQTAQTQQSEDELQRKREAFMMGLLAMKSNFELSHGEKKNE